MLPELLVEHLEEVEDKEVGTSCGTFMTPKMIKIIAGIATAVVVVVIIVVVVVATLSKGENENKNESEDKNKNEDENKDKNTTNVKHLCLDSQGKPSRNCLGGWMYKSTNATYNAQWAANNNWNYALLNEKGDSAEGKQRVRDNLREFQKRNIAVHIMNLDNYNHIFTPATAVKNLNSFLDFINEENLNISGIHIDIEPHALSEWKSGNDTVKNGIFNQYISLMEQLRAVIDEKRPNLVFSAAVAWWYTSHAKQGTLDNGSGKDLVNDKRLDMVFPMIYGGAGGSVAIVVKRSLYLDDGAATCVGISYSDYGDEFQATVDGINQNIRANAAREPYYYGISVFSNKKYPDWST